MFSMELFRKAYATDTTEVVVRGRRFEILVPASLEKFADSEDVFRNFPLWSKVWEASWVLADHLAGMQVEPERRFLEIGSGIGLPGIVAASFGHDITLSEHDAHCLEFLRANALLNHCPDLKILDVDWNRPDLERTFDYIVGSEIAYQERSFEPLRKLIESCLEPGGEVILASGVRETSLEFFRRMQVHFDLKAQKKVLRSKDRVIRVILCTMHRKR